MSGQEIAQRTPQQEVIAQIRSDAFREEVAAVLEDVSVARFTRVAVTALLDNPGLAAANIDRTSLFASLVKCAQDGLLPDGRQAALVVFKDKVQYIPMLGGYRAIAAEYGWTIRTNVVYANDEFDFTIEPPEIRHRSTAPGVERGDLIAAYAVARHRDGRQEQRVMYADEILKRAGIARTDKVWKAWPAEMWAKTPGRDIFQELSLDPGDKRVASLLAADRLTPIEALYGPPISGADGSLESQPAGGEGNPTSAPPAAAGLDAAGYDDEPGVSEPEPEAEPIAGDATEEALQALALAAADYVPPGGKFAAGGSHGPKTIREILDLGPDGAKWLGWALEKVETPPEYAAAVWSFARIFAPAHYQEALAKKEVGA